MKRQKNAFLTPWHHLSAALCLLLLGCVSPQERFDRGALAELNGNYEAAIVEYGKVLSKKPDWPGARERLREAGRQYWDVTGPQIDGHRRAGDAAGAAEMSLTAVQIAKIFADVSEPSPLPAGFAQSLPEICRVGTEQLMQLATGQIRAGDWPAAEATLRRANPLAARSIGENALRDSWGELYLGRAEAEIAAGRASEADGFLRQAQQVVPAGSPAAGRLTQLQGRLADARIQEAVSRAREAVAKGQFRVGYELAATARAMLSPGDHRHAEVNRISEQCLRQGHQLTAYLPWWQTNAAAAAMPPGWVADLSANVDARYWQRPPSPFLVACPPSQIGDLMRRLDYSRQSLSVDKLADLGRRTGANTVVFGEVSIFSVEAGATAEEQVAGRLQNGKPADWVRRTSRFRYRATLSVVIVQTDRSRVIASFDVPAEVDGEITIGQFSGDASTLDLTAADRRWFDRNERSRQKRAIEDKLLERLNELTAARVQQQLLKLIP